MFVFYTFVDDIISSHLNYSTHFTLLVKLFSSPPHQIFYLLLVIIFMCQRKF